MRLLPRTALSIGLLAALTLTGNAQEDAPAAAPAPEPAADEAAAEEEDVPPTPPPGPVTGVAEWEESEGVLIRWRNSDLIKKVQGDNKVYIPVSSDEDQERHLEWLTKEEVSMDNVEFIRVPVRSIYTRDYGPWFVFDGNGEPGELEEWGSVPGGGQWGVWVDGIGVDECGNVYVAEYQTSALYRIGPEGGNAELIIDWYEHGGEEAYGHALEWGSGIDGWSDRSLFLPQPYADNQVTEVDLGVRSKAKP